MISISLIIGSMKVLFYTRIFKNYGRLTELLIQALYDLVPFMVFFFTAIIVFSGVFNVLLNNTKPDEPNDDEYPNLPNWSRDILWTFRNSIGDLQMPDYSYWTEQYKFDDKGKGPKAFSYYFIVAYFWIVWVMNVFTLLIIMLNFVIAAISESYATV